MTLGVADAAGRFEPSCRFCGAVRDCYGIHDRSCTAGGDMISRHNMIRDIIFKYASKAHLNPELERTGVLADPHVLIDLRRPADVMIEELLMPGGSNNRTGRGPMTRTALDIKVINALGTRHIEATRRGPTMAAEDYHDVAMNLNNTAAACEAVGVTYAPLVFTAQGGMAARAEAVCQQIACRIAASTGGSQAEAFAEMADEISTSLALQAARARARRSRRSFETKADAAEAGPDMALWHGLEAAADDEI